MAFEELEKLENQLDELQRRSREGEPHLRDRIVQFTKDVYCEMERAFEGVDAILADVVNARQNQLNNAFVSDLLGRIDYTHAREKFKVVLEICDRLEELAVTYKSDIDSVLDEYNASELFWLLEEKESLFRVTIARAVQEISSELRNYTEGGGIAVAQRLAEAARNELHRHLEHVRKARIALRGRICGIETLLSDDARADVSLRRVDILLYVALGEEFQNVMDVLGGDFEHKEAPDIALTYFAGQIHSPVLGRNVAILVVPAGKMGNTRSATVTSIVIGRHNPANVVVLGIAGSLASDFNPGDVFIPDSVNEYLANSASVGDGTAWTFETSGNRFKTSPRLLNRFGVFRSTQKEYYAQWEQSTVKYSTSLIAESTSAELLANGLTLPAKNKMHVGDDKVLASGPAVGKGTAFVRWMRLTDRKVSAMEMESAGVYDAALMRTPEPRAIAIRGISDFADERKDKIEKIAGNRVRILAVKNAVSLLVAGIQAGLFREDVDNNALFVPAERRTDPKVKQFNIKVDQIFNSDGEFIGEGLEQGELEAQTLAQEILNARNAGYIPDFKVRYLEAEAIVAEKERLVTQGISNVRQRREVARSERRLLYLQHWSNMVQRQLEILFGPKLSEQLPDYADAYALRIMGILEFMRKRSGWSEPTHHVRVWNVNNNLDMVGPIGQEECQREEFREYVAGRGEHEDYIMDVYGKLRDRLCFPIMLDLIAQTTFIPHMDRAFGSYGPLPDDNSLFDLNNWRVSLE